MTRLETSEQGNREKLPEGGPEEHPAEKPGTEPDERSEEQQTSSSVRCPVDGHEGVGCNEVCVPLEGIGMCGRPAPHAKKKRRR